VRYAELQNMKATGNAASQHDTREALEKAMPSYAFAAFEQVGITNAQSVLLTAAINLEDRQAINRQLASLCTLLELGRKKGVPWSTPADLQRVYPNETTKIGLYAWG
jgi:hypothetical protein